ncbi:MAG TPA: tetratricopeptide repeat protein, partial [Isosphaeraceae bacterium]
LVSMRNLLGFVLCTTGRLADAESVIRRTIELEEQLVAQSPEVPTYRQKLAMDCGNLGSVLMDTGRLAEAERLFRRAIEIDERLVAQSPGPTAYRGELASQWTNLGNVLQRTGRGPEAERAFRRAITLDEGLAAESAGPNPDLWSGLGADLMNLASLLVSRGELAEARHLVDRAILRQRAALALKPRQPQFHEYLGAQYRLLVNIALQSGDHAEAARAAEEVIRAVPERVRDVPSAAGVLAHCAQMARQDPNLLPEERAALAESYAGRAEALIRDAAGRVGADPDGLNDLAWLLATSPESRFRDPARAVELARKAVALTPKNGNSWNTLGVALYRAGDWNGSISALEQSMTLRGGGDATDWFFLAMARRRRHEEDRARSWYDKAVAWMEENQPNNEELRHFRAEAAALIGAVPSMPDGIEAFAHSDSPQSGSAAATARSQSLDNSHAVPSSTRPGSAASSSQDALSNTAGVGRRLDPTNP